MMIIKVRKGLRNNIIGSLLLGSSIVATTPIQASQRPLSQAERERRAIREDDKRANEAAAKKMVKLLREGHEAVQKYIKENANTRKNTRENAKREQNKRYQQWIGGGVRYACRPK
jgi:hypothetical protein